MHSSTTFPALPGVQLYYAIVREGEDEKDAAERLSEYTCAATTIILDLEDGCKQKDAARKVLRRAVAKFRRNNPKVQIAVRINPHGTDAHALDLAAIADVRDYVNVLMLAKAGEQCGPAEIAALAQKIRAMGRQMTIQPIIESVHSLQMAQKLLRSNYVSHAVFGIHDFSKDLGLRLSVEDWPEELAPYSAQLRSAARMMHKGVIDGVDTPIGSVTLPDYLATRADVEAWLKKHGDDPLRTVYRHARRSAQWGYTGKQVIHPTHVTIVAAALSASLDELIADIDLLRAGELAGVLHGGAIRLDGVMYDPPMFTAALERIKRAAGMQAPALRQMSTEQAEHFARLLSHTKGVR